jgi:WD40 repeat protein
VSDVRPASSIAARTKPVATDGATVVGLHFLGDRAAFVLGEESILLAAADGSAQRVAVHAGAILCAASDGKRLATGGDDGNVVVTDAQGGHNVVASDERKRWIDQIALGPDNSIAWSAGKTAFVKTGKGEIRTFDAVSSVGGLAFAPKGFRVAVAHYNGVSLWFPNAQKTKPDLLTWKGSHLAVTWSPDGKFLVTAMQEPMLHGWRLTDAKNMRMSGYAARIRSMAWTHDGDWLATGGSDQLILWPFHGKDGPMGKEPKLLAPHASRLAVVAAHPKQDVVAAGFADGMVLLVRIDDAAEILVKKPGNAPVTAAAFSPDGKSFAFGCEDGEAGIVDLG